MPAEPGTGCPSDHGLGPVTGAGVASQMIWHGSLAGKCPPNGCGALAGVCGSGGLPPGAERPAARDQGGAPAARGHSGCRGGRRMAALASGAAALSRTPRRTADAADRRGPRRGLTQKVRIYRRYARNGNVISDCALRLVSRSTGSRFLRCVNINTPLVRCREHKEEGGARHSERPSTAKSTVASGGCQQRAALRSQTTA